MKHQPTGHYSFVEYHSMGSDHMQSQTLFLAAPMELVDNNSPNNGGTDCSFAAMFCHHDVNEGQPVRQSTI